MTTTEDSPLNLSDDQLDNFDWNSFIDQPEEPGDNQNEQDDGEEGVLNDAEGENTPEGSLDPLEEENDAEDASNDTEEDVPEKEDSEDQEEAPTEAKEEQAPTDDTPPTVEEYESIINEVFEPFKANGKLIEVDSVEDVRTLMQMGANYNKKMAALKPHLKVVKLLDKHKLLDEEKINFLIDLSKKDAGAIKKLVKDSNIELDKFEDEDGEETPYSPKSYTVSDKEVELDQALEEIRDTATFDTTIDIISNKWDGESKQVLYGDPTIIPIINEHVSSGIYDKISAVMEKERMLGRLKGISDIEAYRIVGDAMHEKGLLLDQPQQQTPKSKSTKPDPDRVNKRKAAASPKGSSAKSSAKADFNPLSMSDEEFEKIASKQYF